MNFEFHVNIGLSLPRFVRSFPSSNPINWLNRGLTFKEKPQQFVDKCRNISSQILSGSMVVLVHDVLNKQMCKNKAGESQVRAPGQADSEI